MGLGPLFWESDRAYLRGQGSLRGKLVHGPEAGGIQHTQEVAHRQCRWGVRGDTGRWGRRSGSGWGGSGGHVFRSAAAWRVSPGFCY